MSCKVGRVHRIKQIIVGNVREQLVTDPQKLDTNM